MINFKKSIQYAGLLAVLVTAAGCKNGGGGGSSPSPSGSIEGLNPASMADLLLSQVASAAHSVPVLNWFI